MRVKNTSRLDDTMLCELLEFAGKGVNTNGVEVHVKNMKWSGYRGRCYNGVPLMANVAETTRCLVTLAFGPTRSTEIWNCYILKMLDKKWPHRPLESLEDNVVYIAAHEFRHWWQYLRKQRARRAGKRVSGKLEYDAVVHGIKMLNKYRVHTGRSPIEPVKQPNPFQKEAISC